MIKVLMKKVLMKINAELLDYYNIINHIACWMPIFRTTSICNEK